jgi:hypothetical protein
MITTTGKSIIAKYLIDQAPSYAAYIAVGGGHNPRTSAKYNPYTVTAANISSNVVNVTATSHGFNLGDYVFISNVNSTINGTHLITNVTTNNFRFDLVASNATNTGLSSSATLSFENKEKLDFEMFRVPIISRSYSVNENGISQVTFSAELPSQERYYMTEAGVFSAGSNPIAVTSDSRMLSTFSSSENWEYHNASNIFEIKAPASEVPPLEVAPAATYGGTAYQVSTVINPNLSSAFLLDNTDGIFSSTYRSDLQHKEQPRMLKNSITVAGNMSAIDTTNTTWTTVVSSVDQPHIHLTGQTYPMDINSSSDELVLAFSIIRRYPADDNPTNVYILVEFSSEENDANQAYAKMQIELSSTDFANNDGYYYFVKRKTLADLLRSSNFTWESVKIAKVYVEVIPTTRSITNKALTSNVATITTSAAHYVAVGDSITVAGVDATFNGTYTVTAVSNSSNTISYAKTNANVTSAAVSPAGTLTRDGQSMFVALDGLRFENNFDTAANPLYGMTTYSPVKDSNSKPALKDTNSKNLIDVKLNLGLNVGG